MKKIFLFLFLLLSVAGFSQIPRYTKIAHRYQWLAGVFDSTLHIPKGATPSLYTGGHTGSGALFYRTSDSSVYYYTGSQWLKVGSSALAFTTPLVNSSGTVSINGLSGYGSSGQLIRSNGTALEYFTPTYILAADTAAMLSKYMRNVFKKAGTDSVFKDVGGTISFAFIDSTGAGGSTLFPISGTGTATGTVTGDMNNNQLNINNATYIEINLSDAYSISGNNGAFGTTNFFLKPDDTDIEYGLHSKSTFGGIREVGIRGFGPENTFYAIAAGDTSSVIIDANTPSITLDAFSVRFKDGSLGSASNGYVWKLINSTTGEGGWVAESGGLSDGDKGDITVSGSGATFTIDNDVVTFAKMQNIAQDRLLGRLSSGTGDIEQLDSSQVAGFIGMEELKIDTTYERLMTLGTPNVLKSIDIVSGSNISVSKSVDTDSTLVFSVSSTNTGQRFGAAGEDNNLAAIRRVAMNDMSMYLDSGRLVINPSYNSYNDTSFKIGGWAGSIVPDLWVNKTTGYTNIKNLNVGNLAFFGSSGEVWFDAIGNLRIGGPTHFLSFSTGAYFSSYQSSLKYMKSYPRLTDSTGFIINNDTLQITGDAAFASYYKPFCIRYNDHTGTEQNLFTSFGDGKMRFYKYGSGSSFISSDTTVNRPAAFDVNGNLVRMDSWKGSGSSGEANTASNIGTAGVGLWKDKTGVDLRFKKINAGSNKVIITDDVGNNEVDIDIDATKFPVTLIDTTNVIRLATKIGTSPDSMVIKSVTFDYDAPVIASVDEDTDSSFTVRFSLDPEFTESVYRERYIQLLANDSNSTTTLANASNMWFEAEDSTMYEIEFTGAFQSAVTTTGIQMALDIPDGQVIGGMIAPTSNTAAGMVFQKTDNAINGGTGTTGVATATSNTWIQAKWNYYSNAGGTVNLKYASEVGSSQVKLIKNISWMRVKKIKKY